jgi:glutathione S-transferase
MAEEEQSERVESLVRQVNALTPETVDKPTLVYFNIIGICWPIRCMLHINDVDYDMIRIPIQDWAYRDEQGVAPLIESFRNTHVPLYVDDQVYLTQSLVMLNYLAEKYDLLGSSPTEKFATMDVMAHAYDALFHWGGLFNINVRMNIPQEIVEARHRAFMGEGIYGMISDGYQRNLSAFLNYLQANPTDSGYMVGKNLTVADLHAFNILCNWYKAFDRDRFSSSFPRLDTYLDHIAAHSRIQDFIENHQEQTVWFQLPDLALRLTSPAELKNLTNISAT